MTADELPVSLGEPTVRRPDRDTTHGFEAWSLVCTTCGFEWLGEAWEACPRCIEQLEAEHGRFDEYQSNAPNPPPWCDNTHLDLVDWRSAFSGDKRDDAIVDGLIIPGRWTAIGAPGKAGKSTLLLAVAVAITHGHDPFDHSQRPPATVVYCDAEMGRLDVVDRLSQIGCNADDLAGLHYTDLVPKLDTDQGAARLLATVDRVGATIVVLDGINGFVEGPENDDQTWRHLFENAIAPMKRAGVAVLTADNLGKDKTKGLRGSTVKVDKPDAVVIMARTDRGVRLTATHRRTVDYPTEQLLTVTGLDGSEPIRYRHADNAWPAGTADAVAILEELNVPLDYGRGRAADMLAEARDRSTPAERDRYRMRTEVLAAALRSRRTRPTDGVHNKTTTIGTDAGTGAGTGRNPPKSDSRDRPTDMAPDLHGDSLGTGGTGETDLSPISPCLPKGQGKRRSTK